MTVFSNQPGIRRTAPVPTNLAAKLLALSEEHETNVLLDDLAIIYHWADSLKDPGCDCRKCARCCMQQIRPLAAYAVEAAYAVAGTVPGEIPVVTPDEGACPMLTDAHLCRRYDRRPLGCRLFLPWLSWDPQYGCDSYPHDRDAALKIGSLLHRTEQLNTAFIWKLGLQRDLDFDYLGHWSITQWFESFPSADGGSPAFF